MGAADAALQRGHVVAGAGDVVPAAEIQPLHFGQQVAKFIGRCVQRYGQRVSILLTQGVEMQAVQQRGQCRVSRHGGIPLRAGCAQATAGGTGVINRVAVLRRALRVDTQAHALPRCFGRGAELCQLCRRVEDDMVGILQQFFHFVRAVGRAEDMNFFAGHFLRAQPRFKQAAGFGARQVRRQQRV